MQVSRSKRISILAIFAASILVMLTHAFIPHHHHTHSIVSHKENSCTESKDVHHDDHDTPIPPIHCHAFNDADWFKQDQDNNVIVIKTVVLTVLNVTSEEPSKQKLNFATRRISIKTLEYFSYYSTRPPPIFS